MSRDGRTTRRMMGILTRRMATRGQDPQTWLEEAAMALSVLAESGKHSADNPHGGTDPSARSRAPGAALDALICLEVPRVWLQDRLEWAPPSSPHFRR